MHKSLLMMGLWLSLSAGANGQPVSNRLNDASATTVYRNERFGFELAYPSSVFEPSEVPDSGQGGVFTSRDGAARLLVSAGQNATGETLKSYRQFILNTSYPDARIEYAPTRGTWFVLSGTTGDTMFYERITFRCGGRTIYGWQMTYPAAERKLYDAIVEAIHRSYRPGKGEGGNC